MTTMGFDQSRDSEDNLKCSMHQVSGFDAIHVCQIDNFQNPAWDPHATCNPSKIDGLVVCGMSAETSMVLLNG